MAKMSNLPSNFNPKLFSDWDKQDKMAVILDSPGSVHSATAMSPSARRRGEDKKQENSFSFFIKQRTIQINLAIMCLSWLTCSLNNTLISFLLKYMPGNIFFNGFMSCTSELVGTFITGIAMLYYDGKTLLKASYGLAGVGGVLMLVYLVNTQYYSYDVHEFSNASMLIFGGLILVVKFGCAAAFNVLYGNTTAMFPPLFSVSAFGISNFLARTCTFFSRPIAEIQSLFPISLMTVLFSVSMAASSFLTVPRDLQTSFDSD